MLAVGKVGFNTYVGVLGVMRGWTSIALSISFVNRDHILSLALTGVGISCS